MKNVHLFTAFALAAAFTVTAGTAIPSYAAVYNKSKVKTYYELPKKGNGMQNQVLFDTKLKKETLCAPCSQMICAPSEVCIRPNFGDMYGNAVCRDKMKYGIRDLVCPSMSMGNPFFYSLNSQIVRSGSKYFVDVKGSVANWNKNYMMYIGMRPADLSVSSDGSFRAKAEFNWTGGMSQPCASYPISVDYKVYYNNKPIYTTLPRAVTPFCGNRIREPGEQCDTGTDNVLCTPDCKLMAGAVC